MKKRHFLPLQGAVAGSFPGSWLVIWSLAGWLAVMGAVQGQENGLKFRHLSTADGLSHSSITHILQDRQGYMWIATEDGLDRYDGYRFTSFAAQPAGKGSVSGSWVSPQRLFEDRSGGIWVNFVSGGVARYDPATEAFVHYFHEPGSPRGLSHDKVTCFYQGPSGTVWLGTQEGLNRYVPATGGFRRYFLEKNAKGPANQITRILEDRRGRLWVGTQYGLYLLDPDTGTSRAFYPNPAQPKLSNTPNWHNWISELYEDRRGRLWVGTHRSGLLRLITENPGGAEAFTFSPCRQEGLQLTLITFLRESGKGDLWVGTNRGVVRLRESHKEGQRVERYLHEAARLDKYGHYPAQYFYEDRRGNIWVASPKNLYRFDADRNGFSPVLHNPNDPGSLSSNAVTSMYEDRAGVLWFGTLKGGLNLLNTHRKPFRHFRHLPGDSVPWTTRTSIRSGKTGRVSLWIGTYTGLNRYDPVTGRFELYRRTPAGKRPRNPKRWA
jgi:ligand-binding sensor domain-containing protein